MCGVSKKEVAGIQCYLEKLNSVRICGSNLMIVMIHFRKPLSQIDLGVRHV